MKYPQLAALDSMSGGPVKRFDDVNFSAFVENELKDIIPELYDRLYRELDARQHIPLSTNVNPGAMSWAYDSFDKRGHADFLGANADMMPRADVMKQRTTLPIRTVVTAYGWTLEEIEASRFAGTELDRRKAEAARRSVAEKEHSVLLSGDVPRQIPGFLTNPVTPRVTIPNGSWLTQTNADNILADMNAVVDSIWIGSNKVHKPNTVLLPLPQYRKIQTLRIANTGLSVIEYFMRTNGFIMEVLPLIELSTAGVSGNATMLAYEKSPANLSGIVPLAFQQLDPQLRGFEVVVPCREKIGGTCWFYPLSGAFGDGI
jgi:hypothetical protein